MNLRVWVIVALLCMSCVANGFLMYTEFVPLTAQMEMRVQEEQLPLVSYTKGQRQINLAFMGLTPEDVEQAGVHFKEYDKQKKPFFAMFDNEETGLRDVSRALCPGGKIPQPYSALSVLVQEANKTKTVINVRVGALIKQPWFDETQARGLYKEWEQQVRVRQDDATVMAVSAMLLGESSKALKHEQPWGRGLFTNGTFNDVKREYPPASRLVPEYFALMHFMAELANDDSQGICN